MLYCVKVPCDRNGKPTKQVEFSSKSGDNFNHKAEWAKLDRKLTGGHAYNYYPRGRVEIKDKRKAKIFLNPDIATDEIIAYIVEKFRLQHRKVKVIADGSKHYHCAEKDKV